MNRIESWEPNGLTSKHEIGRVDEGNSQVASFDRLHREDISHDHRDEELSESLSAEARKLKLPLTKTGAQQLGVRIDEIWSIRLSSHHSPEEENHRGCHQCSEELCEEIVQHFPAVSFSLDCESFNYVERVGNGAGCVEVEETEDEEVISADRLQNGLFIKSGANLNSGDGLKGNGA